MTKIDFYELKYGRFSPEQLLCQLSLKAYQSQKHVLLLTQTEEQSQRLDKALWTFDDTQFVPHELNSKDKTLKAIHISHQTQANEAYDILINTHQDIPSHIGQFKRVIELVHDQNKESARQHFRYYKERGYLINHEKV